MFVVIGKLLEKESPAELGAIKVFGPLTEQESESFMSQLFWADPDNNVAPRFDWVVAAELNEDGPITDQPEFKRGQ